VVAAGSALLIGHRHRGPGCTGGSTRALPDGRAGSCGPAALLAAGALSRPDAAARLHDAIECQGLATRAVTSLFDLAQCARQAGFEPVGVAVGAQQLDRLPLPAVAHVAPDHFLVLADVRDDHVVVVDQAREFALSRAEFGRRFCGYALCLRR